MKIGIIGAGQIGGTLARRFSQLGYDVYVANSRGPNTLTDLAKETGAKPVTASDAARLGDLVVVTIPEGRIRDLPDDLFSATPPGVPVVDTCNYYPRERDGRIDEIEDGLTESGWVGQRLGRPVIKAFNNIHARDLLNAGKPKGSPDRIALPVAGDDAKAKAIVLRLIDELGFDGVDAGSLDQSWRQQPGTPVYGTNRNLDGVKRGLAEARPERPPAFSGTEESPGTFDAPA